MSQGKLFEQILNPANRHNPYPLYAQLRETPISQQEDGTYVVSTYREIEALLYDPRISSDERKSTRGPRYTTARVRQRVPGSSQPFILLDQPDHNRLRRMVMRQFTPERVEGMRDRVIQLADELLDAQRNRNQLDIVDDFAHPLPVRMISELLGVPIEDKARFEVWVSALTRTIEPAHNLSEAEVVESASQAVMQMTEYLRGLIAARRDRPRGDLISALVVSTSHDDAGQMNEQELLASLQLLVAAGFETTVNSITNGMLTLLRHPDVIARLRRDRLARLAD